MCGIAGFVGKAPIDSDAIQRTLALMRNRGPDHRDFRSFEDGGLHVSLLFTRLSIIDLDSRANQPFTIGDCTLVFNGEIYNYVELRKRLEQRGVTFHTSSDTEVLLQSYLTYGESCVKDFEGMWAFAIYDRRGKTVLLSRDRFAEKPLYYCERPEGFYFGSEVKFLSALAGVRFEVNEKHLLRYYVNGYKSLYKTQETYFHGIKEVPNATSVEISRDLKPRFSSYWKPRYAPAKMSLDEAIEGVRHHFMESIRIRLRADVPLAFCLSGGVDSSSIVSVAAKRFGCDVATFTIHDRDERYDEAKNLQATLKDLGCKSTLIELRQEKNLDQIARLVAYHDAPIATITYYVHSFLSEAIARSGYRVVFSGTGADELFTGYYDHFNLHLYEVRHHPERERWLADWRTHTATFVRNPFLQDPDLYIKDPDFRGVAYMNNEEFATYLKKDFREEFTEERYADSLLRNRMMNELFHEATRVILHEDDLNSMMYSIENRSPYLDSRLFEFAFSIPHEHLIRDGYGKYLLREAMKGILNDAVRLDRQKKGFNAGIRSVLDLEAPGVRERLLDKSRIFDLVRRDKVEELLKMKSIPNSYSKFLWNFINMKLFVDQVGTA